MYRNKFTIKFILKNNGITFTIRNITKILTHFESTWHESESRNVPGTATGMLTPLTLIL